MSSFWSVAGELQARSCPFTVITMIASRGSAPQDPGAKAIVTPAGLQWGTVGGGKVEARAIEHARGRLAGGRREPELVTWNLQTQIGMSCGGEATFLFECHHRAAWRIALFGAGHVAQAVVRVLTPLECHVTCADPRAEWTDRLPKADNMTRVVSEDLPAAVARFDEETFFVVMTQGHATDRPILQEILRRFPNAPYVGVMGSDLKAKKIRKELVELGVPAETVARLRSPIGLPLGGNHPHEIALSVAGQMIQVRDAWRGSASARGEQHAAPRERDTDHALL